MTAVTEMVEFKCLRAARRALNRLTNLDLRRADFGLFRDLLHSYLAQCHEGKWINIQRLGAINCNKEEIR